jgi:hypothetical protein
MLIYDTLIQDVNFVQKNKFSRNHVYLFEQHV